MNTLGLDIGTSGCKAVVFDSTGRPLASAKRAYALRFTPDGGAELDPREVLALSLEVIAETAGQAGGVAAIGISSQGEAFTAVNAKGDSLCPAMVSSDGRATPFLAPFLESFGRDRLYEITGHTAHPMFTLFKMLWLRHTNPAVWRHASRFLCFEDLLCARLGVEPAMGWPLAARTMLFDVRQQRWSAEILAELDLTESHLARPLPSGSVAGTIPASICSSLRLEPGCIVVAGGHDQPCAALGAGVTQPGTAMYATGTVECICPAFGQPVLGEALREANLCTYNFSLPELFTTVAFSLTGGNILQWFRDEFGQAEIAAAATGDTDVYELLLRCATSTPSPLLVLPYFTPSGTPFFDPSTRGAILGLRLSSTRGEILRALLEGVAFEMRLNLEILASVGCEIHELRVVGGGAKSAFWNQLKADVLDRPVATIDCDEAGCLGVALLARSALTGESAAELSPRWTKIANRYLPNSAQAEAYDRKFEAYCGLYPALSRLRV
ncbi:xylulokinase [soil metagenome]